MGRSRVAAAHHSLSARLEQMMWSRFSRFVYEDGGQDLIEYALLAALISIVCVLAITNVGTKVSSFYGNLQSSIP
jgi:Flp pilus assembly pilin Flp